MANKSTDTNNDMPEVVKKSWLPFSLILTITGAITAIYNFIKLWQGDQRLITTIMVVAGLIVSIAILLQVSFSKIPEKENSASLKRHNKTKSIYSYKPLIRYTAQAMLIAILLATIGGVFFLAKQNADLEKKLIIVIATFDGPEEDYGMRNQIVEELNKSLVNLSNV